FLAANKKAMKFTDDEKKGFAKSWEKSAEESLRLLQHIKSCKPHEIIDTISLNNARQTIMILCEPLAEIIRNIQENIAEIKKLKEEIQRLDITDKELKSKLYIPYIELEVKKMKQPKVVCTKIICRISVIQEDCHVKWKWLNTFMQKHNGVMMFGVCKSCGCHAKNHKAIFYKSVSNHIKKLQERIDRLKVHQNTVEDTMIKFTHFLKRNAIVAFNDAYVEYLNHIVHIEKQKIDDTSEEYNNEILKGLEEIKRNYEKNVKTIDAKYEEKVKVINANEKNKPSLYMLTSEDIFKLEKQLYSISGIGKYLQDIKNEEKRAF
ncbi:943_t:CDS:2, partial [Dentiscutata heterogama]